MDKNEKSINDFILAFTKLKSNKNYNIIPDNSGDQLVFEIINKATGNDDIHRREFQIFGLKMIGYFLDGADSRNRFRNKEAFIQSLSDQYDRAERAITNVL